MRSHTIRRMFASVVLVAVALVAAACGSGSDDDDASAGSTTAAPSASTSPSSLSSSSEDPSDGDADADDAVAVETVTETYVDTSRPTDAAVETPAQPERTIETRIVHPASGGPYPLLVMSHGATGHPDEYAESIPKWAAEGFVVAAPIFPLTNRDAPGGMANIGDVSNQPADVSFVIDEVLADNDDPESPLYGLVDPDAIGVVGHSLGGATTWAVAFDETRRDPRIDSVTIFASFTAPMPDAAYDFGSGLPLLVLHGDADDVPLDSDLAAYEQAVSPKWFVTLLGAEHRLAFTDEPSPHDDLVTRTLYDFWHGTLDDDAEALARVTESATDPDLSDVRHE